MFKIITYLTVILFAANVSTYNISQDDYSLLEIISVNEQITQNVEQNASYEMVYKEEGASAHNITYDEDGNYKDVYENNGVTITFELVEDKGTIKYGDSIINAGNIDIQNETKTKDEIRTNTLNIMKALSEPEYLTVTKNTNIYEFSSTLGSSKITGSYDSENNILKYSVNDGITPTISVEINIL